MSSLGTAFLLFFGVGCGDDEMSGEDLCVAGETRACVLDGGGPGVQSCGTDFRFEPCSPAVDSDGGAPFTAPTPPAPPELTPCPTGWEEITLDGFTLCEPYPTGPPSCAPSEVHLPGGSGCETVFGACATGDFPDDLPTDRPVIHVLAGSTGGDGSRARPHDSPEDFAWGGLSDGTVVAVGRGRYDVTLTPSRAIAIRGSCGPETILTTSDTRLTATPLEVGGLGVELTDLTIGPAPRGVRIDSDASATMRRVHLANVEWGITVRTGGVLDLERVVADVVGANGISTSARADVRIAQSAVLGARSAVQAISDGTTISVDIEDTLLQHVGSGVHLGTGAQVSLARTVVSGGFAGFLQSGTLTTEATVVRGSDWGMIASPGSEASIASTWFDAMRGPAVSVDNNLDDPSGALVRLVNSVVSRGVAHGAQVVEGGRFEVERSGFARNFGAHLLVVHDTSSAELRDVWMQDTNEDGRSLGYGLQVRDRATITITRARFSGHAGTAMNADGVGSTLVTTDVLIEAPRALRSGYGGLGVQVQVGATATLGRITISEARQVGLLAYGAGASITAEDVIIDGTRVPDCSPSGCTRYIPAGIGAAAWQGSLGITGFEIRNAETCGVVIQPGGEVDLARGVISDSTLGACIQTPGYDIDRLSNDVEFRNNDTNLETTSDLPVPDPGDVLMAL